MKENFLAALGNFRSNKSGQQRESFGQAFYKYFGFLRKVSKGANNYQKNILNGASN